MKKTVFILGCIITLMFGACGDKEEKAEKAPAPEETAAATPTESPQETVQEEILNAPVEIDTSVPIEKGSRIAVVAKATDGGYWKNMKSHMTEAVEYINQVYKLKGDDRITLTYEGPKTEDDIASQINIIDAVLAENPTVLCLAPIDVSSCEAQMETAAENEIPVVIFDSNVDSELAQIYCGSNNKKCGKDAADKLCEAIGNEGVVAVFAHEQVTKTSQERVQGFRRRLKRKHKEVQLESVSYKSQEVSTEDMIRNILENNEEIKGIFCTNEVVANAALKVLKDYPEREIQMVGFDAGAAQIEAVKNGIEYGFIAQDTYQMAYQTIWTGLRAAFDEEYVQEENIYTPYVWVDQKSLLAGDDMEFLYE